MSLITAKNLTKKYTDVTVLDDLTFAVPKGELLAIVGPNGSGKTTLVKLMLGLEKPTSGTVEITSGCGRTLADSIGYVPQLFTFDRTLPITIREFLDLVSCGHGRHCDLQPVQHVLGMVGMERMEDKKIGKLSGGQLQRVLIARALLHERDILILDEPSTGIDAQGQDALYELLGTLVREHGVTVIVVSHEMDFVSKYATSVLCLNHKLVCHDVPKKAMTKKVMSELYGEAMHHHPHEHHHGGN